MGEKPSNSGRTPGPRPASTTRTRSAARASPVETARPRSSQQHQDVGHRVGDGRRLPGPGDEPLPAEQRAGGEVDRQDPDAVDRDVDRGEERRASPRPRAPGLPARATRRPGGGTRSPRPPPRAFRPGPRSAVNGPGAVPTRSRRATRKPTTPMAPAHGAHTVARPACSGTGSARPTTANPTKSTTSSAAGCGDAVVSAGRAARRAVPAASSRAERRRGTPAPTATGTVVIRR